VIEKLHNLEILKRAIESKLGKLEKNKKENVLKKKYRNLNKAIIVQKVQEDNESGKENGESDKSLDEGNQVLYKFVEVVNL